MRHRCITRIPLDMDEITVMKKHMSRHTEVSFQEDYEVSVGRINIMKLLLTVLHVRAAVLVRQEVLLATCSVRVSSRFLGHA